MRQRSVQCLSPAGLHEMAYAEWGAAANPRVLVCVHGLTRSGRDFDYFARAMSDRYRVVCPDVVGRGRSDWLRDKRHYGIPQYLSDMVTLLARLDAEVVHWVGTSMGGLVGMTLAAQEGNPIRRLVLNDVGPAIAAASIRRIGEFLGKAPRFASLDQAEAYLRVVSAPFGALTDAQWRHLTENVVRAAADGSWQMAYDPGLAEPFRLAMQAEGGAQDVTLWPLYDTISCPTLVLRGAQSDLLTRETAAEMARRGPRAATLEIPGVGHAPMLLDDAQVAPVRDFLLGPA